MIENPKKLGGNELKELLSIIRQSGAKSCKIDGVIDVEFFAHVLNNEESKPTLETEEDFLNRKRKEEEDLLFYSAT